MAGIDVAGGGRGRRRTLDSEVNMIPMIDLLMVTISFLLITAVWTHMARLDASANEPGADTPKPIAPEPVLHVDMREPARFVLRWIVEGTVERSTEVRRAADRSFAELTAAVQAEWDTRGAHHGARDPERDRATLETADDAPYEDIVAVMDAVYRVKRVGTGVAVPAFMISLGK